MEGLLEWQKLLRYRPLASVPGLYTNSLDLCYLPLPPGFLKSVHSKCLCKFLCFDTLFQCSFERDLQEEAKEKAQGSETNAPPLQVDAGETHVTKEYITRD